MLEMKTLEKLDFKSVGGELILLAILFVGLSLRVYHLGYESVWMDEVFSIRLANNLHFFQIVRETSEDVHPPLYYIILHYWINLFSDSEFSVRFPSVIFGFLSILMIFKVGTLIFDREVGVLGALLLSFSSFHIYYSQEVRMYSLMALLTLVSMYFFIRFFKERNFIASVCYILSSILLMYTHVYGLFIIIAQNIYIFTLPILSKGTYKVSLRRWILIQLILLALFTPWIAVFINQVSQVQNDYWVPTPSIRKIIAPLIMHSGSILLFLLFLVLSFFTVAVHEKTDSSFDWKNPFRSIKSYYLNLGSLDSRIYLLIIWLFTPIILPFIISRLSTPIYITRYTIGASLALYLLVAKGIGKINYKYVKLAIIGIIVIGSSVNVWRYYTATDKDQWRDIANYVDTNSEPADLILFNAGFCQPSFDYYSKEKNLIKKPFPERYNYVNEENVKGLRSTVENYNRVWVILAYSTDNKGLIKKTLSESHNLSYNREYVSKSYVTGKSMSIEVYLFERK